MQVIHEQLLELRDEVVSLRQKNVLVIDELESVLHSTSELRTFLRQLTDERTAKAHYSVEEFAKLTNRAEFTVRQWCNEGRINAEKSMTQSGPNNRWVISRAEFDRYSKEGLLPVAKRPR